MSSSSVLRHVIQAKSPPEQSSPIDPAAISAKDLTREGPRPDEFASQLAVLVENAPVALSLFDHEMRYLVANRAWVEEFGLQHVQPLLGRSQYDIFPGLHHGWRQVYDRALQGHIVRSEHDAISGQDGKAIVYRWEVRPWRRQADASVGGLMVVCEKLAANLAPPREEAAELPAEPASGPPSPSCSEAVVECSVPMVTFDQVGRLLAVNQAAVAIATHESGTEPQQRAYWEAFAREEHQDKVKEQLFAAITRLAQDPGTSSQMIVTPSLADSTTVSLTNSACALRWLISRISIAGGPVRFLAVVIPGASPFDVSESASAPPVRQAVAQPPPEPQTPAASVADAAVIRELQEKLNRTRQEVTVLREAEQAFAKREGRQRSVLEAMPTGIVVLDERGMPIYHNQFIARLLGRPIQRGESVEQWLMNACASQSHREKVASLWAQDVWSRQLTRTLSLVTAEGQMREFDFRPVPLSGGGVLVGIHDVTEQCRTEDLLRATEARIRVLMQESSAGILLADKSGAVFDANPEAEKLSGRSKADLRRMSVDEWLSPASAAARREALRALNEEGRKSAAADVRLRLPDGSEPPATLRMAAVTDADGGLHCIVSFLDRQAAPESISMQETAAPTAPVSPPVSATSIPAALMETRTVVRWLAQVDASGRIARWSADAQSVFGFEAAEASGRWLHTIFRPSDPSGFYMALQEQMTRPDEAIAWNYFGKDGRRGSGRFFLKTSGEGGLSVDLYDEHETMVEAAPAQDALEGPQPRTHIVRPSQLWPVCDLDREKLLLSETHHRIKNHLQIISSMLNLQMNSLGDEAARSALRSSQNRVRSIAALHQHLYQLALGEGPGFGDFSRGLSQRLRECYEVPEEQVALHMHITTAHLQQEWMMPLALILNETLSNAFEHAFPASRSGSVTVRLELGDDGMGEFEVSDDGIGLPEAFDPAIAPGLGLKILGVFADQMRGQLRLSGEPGQGTKFNLRFPMAHVDN